jgi:PKD repeat protein
MAAGTYTVTLTATNAGGSDSEVKSGLVTVTVGTGGLAKSAWPKFGGNANNTGLSPYVGSQTGTPKWSLTIPGVSGSYFTYTTPVIGSDGTIYIGDTASNISAINPDGTLKWETATGIASNSPFAIDVDGTIYVGGFDTGALTNGKIYAINPSDGTKKWNTSALTGAAVYSGPAIGADGTVYGGNYLNQFCAFFPENGTVKWCYTTDQIYNYGSPAIGYDGTIYVTSQPAKTLYAINPDGSPRWNFTAGGPFYNSPAIGADGTIYAACYDKKLYAIDPDGNERWNYTAGSYFNKGASPAIADDGTIYAGNQDKYVYAIDPDGNLKWKSLLASRVWASPSIGADGTVYIGDQSNIFYALNPANGSQIWSYTATGKIDGAPSIASDGTVYVATENRVLYAFPGVVSFTADQPAGAGHLTVQFTGTSPLTVTAWNWDFGDDATSTEQNPSHTYTSAGNYTVNLTITHANGTNYLVQTVTVAAPAVSPIANFTATPISGEAPLNVTFTDASTGSPTSWAWDFENDGIVDSTEQNATFTYTTAGTYTVNLTVSNDGGSDAEVKTDYITVSSGGSGGDAPVASFSAAPTSGDAPLNVHLPTSRRGPRLRGPGTSATARAQSSRTRPTSTPLPVTTR